MKVCEICGGLGYSTVAGQGPHGLGTARLLCDSCGGTGVLLIWPESAGYYAQKQAQARRRAAIEGWLEDVWVGLRRVRRRVLALVAGVA